MPFELVELRIKRVRIKRARPVSILLQLQNVYVHIYGHHATEQCSEGSLRSNP